MPTLNFKSWRCFHCDEVFHDFAEAELHFGKSCYSDPWCQLAPGYVRYMEEQLARYREEDTDLHRKIMSMSAEHATALQRAEEQGYAKALKDVNYGEETCQR